MKRPPKPVTPASLEASALWHLARRSLTTAQLTAILARKLARAPEVKGGANIADVVDKMTRLGFLDDARVAESRVRALRSRGESKRKIVQRLRLQGVVATDVTNAVVGETAASELEAARVYARRRRLAAKDPQKALAALARQGFAYDTAKRALAPEDC